MIVHAVGLTSEEVRPYTTVTVGPVSQHAADWLVLSSDRRTRVAVLSAIARNGRTGHDGTADSLPLESLVHGEYRWAFIDLAYPVGGRAAEVERCVDASFLRRPRLVIRAEDGDHAAERWARQAGVSVFLPGDLVEPALDTLIAQISR
jgi:hypothetical protein